MNTEPVNDITDLKPRIISVEVNVKQYIDPLETTIEITGHTKEDSRNFLQKWIDWLA